jgi:hypothetical protein
VAPVLPPQPGTLLKPGDTVVVQPMQQGGINLKM